MNLDTGETGLEDYNEERNAIENLIERERNGIPIGNQIERNEINIQLQKLQKEVKELQKQMKLLKNKW